MTEFPELRQLLGVLIRRWWVLLLAALLGATAGYAYSMTIRPVYEATSSLVVGQSLRAVNLDRNDIQISQELALTYADVARRQVILQGVVDDLGLDDSWRTLRNHISVRLVENTQLLEITADASSRSRAEELANGVAQQLIELSPATLEKDKDDDTQRYVTQRMTSIRARIENAQQRIASLEEMMSSGPSLPAERFQELQDEIEVLDRLIADWDATFARMLAYVEVPQGDNYLAIVEPAQVKTDPVEPRTRFNILIGLLAGLALAAGLVLLLDQLDNTLKSAQDVEKELTLGTIGSVSLPKGHHLSLNIAVWQGAESRAAEDYRLISTKIQYMANSWSRKVIVMTSTAEGPSKSIVIANLAVALAETGLRIILIDADLRNPVQQRIFQVPQREGLTDLLRISTLDPESLLVATPEPNLRLLPSGELPSSPAEYLASRQMDTLLARLSQQADMIFCDCAEAATLADAPALSNYADAVLLVLESGKSGRDEALQALQNLQQAGANVVGAVLCTFSARTASSSPAHPDARVKFQKVSPKPGA